MGDSGVSERLVNQLLTSLDGLETMEGVVTIGATNRPDMLDPALLRPGRFDRLIMIPVPDEGARLEILHVHTRNMPLDTDVNLERLAEDLVGYVGADIESLCREAAMHALRVNRDAVLVRGEDFDEARKTVFPSVDEATVKMYEGIGEEMQRRAVRKPKEEVLGYYR